MANGPRPAYPACARSGETPVAGGTLDRQCWSAPLRRRGVRGCCCQVFPISSGPKPIADEAGRQGRSEDLQINHGGIRPFGLMATVSIGVRNPSFRTSFFQKTPADLIETAERRAPLCRQTPPAANNVSCHVHPLLRAGRS